MEMYLNTTLPDHVKEILSGKDDPLFCSQDLIEAEFNFIQENLADIIETLCMKGQLVVIANDDVVITVKRKTAWVCEFDTKAREGLGLKAILKASKQFFQVIREKTLYHKCESRTPLEKLAKTLARLSGCEIEGTCRKSYQTREGKMVNEYIVGMVIDREVLCQSS